MVVSDIDFAGNFARGQPTATHAMCVFTDASSHNASLFSFSY